MDTKQFLDAILPANGLYCVGLIGTRGFEQRFVDDFDRVSHLADTFGPRTNVYHGCATYSGNGRKADDVVAVRSFWLDIDAQEGKPRERYVNRREAASELAKFCNELLLPKPLVVDSGYGLHAYWPCEDMSPEDWHPTAQLLKAATIKWGLSADMTRTADIASILRPPGTSNHKAGTVRPVRVVTQGVQTSRAVLHKALRAYVGADISAPSAVSLNSDLTSMGEFVGAPSDAFKIADNCAVVDLVRETRGDTDEPTWYGVLGVLYHTIQGEDLCHDWSKGYAGYSAAETDRKLAQISKLRGPSTCVQLNALHPERCQVCPHRNKISTPLELGRPGAEVPTAVETILPSGEKVVEHFEFPKGYGWGPIDGHKGDVLYYTTWETVEVDTEGGKQQQSMATQHFLAEYKLVATRRISSNDIFSMTLRFSSKAVHKREFTVPLSTIFEGGKTLFSELGSREVGVPMALRTQMHQYLMDWARKLREEYDETPSVSQFGWHRDGFVVGEDYITSQGRKQAALASNLNSTGKHLTCRGSLEKWVELVDYVYNRPGEEARQYIVASTFGAPLVSMFNGTEAGGTIFAYTPDSGYGKSTVGEVVVSAWGDHKELVLKEYTDNALYGHAGWMNNIPVVLDELTNASPDFCSKLAYAMSAGKGKLRMTQDAGRRDTLNWSTLAYANGNRRLTDIIGNHRSNTEAEQVRVFEFELRVRGQVPKVEMDRITPQFRENCGHAGRVFMDYVAANKIAVREQLFKTREMFDARMGIATQERYWSVINASVLTGLQIAKQLRLLKFEVAPMLSWIKTVIEDNRTQVVSTLTDPREIFGELISSIYSGILVTHGVGSVLSTGQSAMVAKDPQGPITGRLILPTTPTERETLYVSTATIKEWCARRGYVARDIFDAVVREGWVSPVVQRVVLGKGTSKYSGLTGQVRCWEVLPHVIHASAGGNHVAQKVSLAINNDA